MNVSNTGLAAVVRVEGGVGVGAGGKQYHHLMPGCGGCYGYLFVTTVLKCVQIAPRLRVGES